MPEHPGVPVYLRIGDNDEHCLGLLHSRDAMPDLLRTAANEFERGLSVPDQNSTDEEML